MSKHQDAEEVVVNAIKRIASIYPTVNLYDEPIERMAGAILRDLAGRNSAPDTQGGITVDQIEKDMLDFINEGNGPTKRIYGLKLYKTVKEYFANLKTLPSEQKEEQK